MSGAAGGVAKEYNVSYRSHCGSLNLALSYVNSPKHFEPYLAFWPRTLAQL